MTSSKGPVWESTCKSENISSHIARPWGAKTLPEKQNLLINSINSLESTKKEMSHLNWTRENIFTVPTYAATDIFPAVWAWPSQLSRGAPELIWNSWALSPWLKWSHSSPFWELKCHLALEKTTIVRLLMALLQMGLKSPCFTVLHCTPKRTSKRLATHFFQWIWFQLLKKLWL